MDENYNILFLKELDFTLESGSAATWNKIYPNHENYEIRIDLKAKNIDYGKKIQVQDKTTSNFSARENFVVLECVNRLLEKGYKPENIILEKKWPTGHGTSGKLDILVTRDDNSAYMMIECKTPGKAFNNALKKTYENGGQLFTYFQQDKLADILMLYSCDYHNEAGLSYQNEIIKIEDPYRQAGNVDDFYVRWNKLTKNNGVFDAWVKPYDFKSRALTPNTLKEISQEDSGRIFNQFLEILRHNVVSDKPNAFNKVFTLFLCKIYDEKVTRPDEELAFQWFHTSYTYDGISYPPDNDTSFQKRLTDLYKRGMKEFLDKEVTDISDAEFAKKYDNIDQDTRKKLLDDLVEIRLKKNNEFAFKEVYDNASFEENAKVVKEVVDLLQGYRIRYTTKQQYLSDFFEMLLTTGLKQEAGQFFTPVPIAQFIIKSLPLDRIVEEKLKKGESNNYLPTMIDYAAGSGHFITEGMHEIQNIINRCNPDKYTPDVARKIKSWKTDHFDWAYQYVYGIEKDYRLVKVGKVGCYLHGDGLAQIIHSDGLADFDGTPDYKNLLQKISKDNPQENGQFDIVVSNPPYSVSSFRDNASKYYGKEDFELYNFLTDQSSEIECLFIERTKQLLKEGGLAGVILPSSILSNGSSIYTKSREIIFKYFDIVGIAELGSNTFMATSTNTIVLFLRRRDNYTYNNIFERVQKIFSSKSDVSINQIQSPVRKYVDYVWDGLNLEDYWTLLEKHPNEAVQNHEIYKNYENKSKDNIILLDDILAQEAEKLSYFILTCEQKIIVVKSGKKKEEKEFLGYEFSTRRGNEGIHSILRGKTIDECTKLFDSSSFSNPEKASTYLYKAFNGDFETEIDSSLKNNISCYNLIDMMTFDREYFDKAISTASKKKIKIESRWQQFNISILLDVLETGNRPKGGVGSYDSGIPSLGGEHIDNNGRVITSKEKLKYVPTDYFKKSQKGILCNDDILICKDGALTGKIALFRYEEVNFSEAMINEHVFLLRCNKNCLQFYLFQILFSKQGQSLLQSNITGQAQGGLNKKNLLNIKVPLPPMEVQEKIVAEIEQIEKEEREIERKIVSLKKSIFNCLDAINSKGRMSTLCSIRKQKVNPQKHLNEEFINIGLEDIESHTGKILSQPKMYGSTILSAKNLFRKNDVLYGKLRPYLNKVAVAQTNGICSTDILVLKTTVPSIVKYILLSSQIVEQTSVLVSGLRMPRIKSHDLMKLIVPLPSDNEQENVVAYIEKTEAQIEKLQEQLAKIALTREAVLKKYL